MCIVPDEAKRIYAQISTKIDQGKIYPKNTPLKISAYDVLTYLLDITKAYCLFYPIKTGGILLMAGKVQMEYCKSKFQT